MQPMWAHREQIARFHPQGVILHQFGEEVCRCRELDDWEFAVKDWDNFDPRELLSLQHAASEFLLQDEVVGVAGEVQYGDVKLGQGGDGRGDVLPRVLFELLLLQVVLQSNPLLLILQHHIAHGEVWGNGAVVGDEQHLSGGDSAILFFMLVILLIPANSGLATRHAALHCWGASFSHLAHHNILLRDDFFGGEDCVGPRNDHSARWWGWSGVGTFCHTTTRGV